MIMKYRHTKTGAVIETTAVLGGNWKPLSELKKSEEPAPKKKGTAKK